MILTSRSCKMHPLLPLLTLGGTLLKESDIHVLGVTFDFKMPFEKHFSLRAASQRLGV